MNEDFSLGKMSADARLTATFKYYEKTIQNVKKNETVENPALLIAERYRKKMITDGRDHVCFHTGARCGK